MGQWPTTIIDKHCVLVVVLFAVLFAVFGIKICYEQSINMFAV